VNLAVSNIAWPNDADAEAAGLLQRHGIRGVELAPRKVWPEPASATAADAVAVRRWWEDRGIQIVAFQALLFGRPELILFGSDIIRRQLADYLARIIDLATWVGARVLVFGSPKNRLRGERKSGEVWPMAVDFFRTVGAIAAARGVVVGIEANPAEYGGDFLTHVADVQRFVREVNSPGVGLHLDAGGMRLTGETPRDAEPVLPVHYHLSEPSLMPLGSDPELPHAAWMRAVAATGYRGWYSIEMRQPGENWSEQLQEAVVRAQALLPPVDVDG
jgi:D-psicose/D-tagatose/L-ribulose 3-epimerase